MQEFNGFYPSSSTRSKRRVECPAEFHDQKIIIDRRPSFFAPPPLRRSLDARSRAGQAAAAAAWATTSSDPFGELPTRSISDNSYASLFPRQLERSTSDLTTSLPVGRNLLKLPSSLFRHETGGQRDRSPECILAHRVSIMLVHEHNITFMKVPFNFVRQMGDLAMAFAMAMPVCRGGRAVIKPARHGAARRRRKRRKATIRSLARTAVPGRTAALSPDGPTRKLRFPEGP